MPSSTRIPTCEQDATVERLALEHGGRVAVRDGFADGSLTVTAVSGACWSVNEDGVPTSVAPNHSVDWSL